MNKYFFYLNDYSDRCLGFSLLICLLLRFNVHFVSIYILFEPFLKEAGTDDAPAGGV